jgi:integrase
MTLLMRWSGLRIVDAVTLERHRLHGDQPQSAKRKKIPAVPEIADLPSLLGALDPRERTMVRLDVVTELRASDLFGLKWTDIDSRDAIHPSAQKEAIGARFGVLSSFVEPVNATGFPK